MNRTALIIFLLAVVGFGCLAKPSGVLAASLSLSPAVLTKTIGETFTVDIIVDPVSDSISGASAIVDYDSSKLTAVSVTKGALFSQELTSTIGTSTTDPTKGEVRYDGGTLGGTAITTRGVMATITFRAIAAGTAMATFVFDPTVTTGTSLVTSSSSPTNLLQSVSQGSYSIVASGGTTTTTQRTVLYATGAVENTIAIFVGGLIFLGSGVFLARRIYCA